jgi:hypothetical protein
MACCKAPRRSRDGECGSEKTTKKPRRRDARLAELVRMAAMGKFEPWNSGLGDAPCRAEKIWVGTSWVES